MRPSIPSKCRLCQRELKLTFHHLIPKTLHKKRWVKCQFSSAERQAGIWLCRSCHDAVHRLISNKELAQNFRTPQTLIQHPALNRHIEWAKKQRKVRIYTKRKSSLP